MEKRILIECIDESNLKMIKVGDIFEAIEKSDDDVNYYIITDQAKFRETNDRIRKKYYKLKKTRFVKIKNIAKKEDKDVKIASKKRFLCDANDDLRTTISTVISILEEAKNYNDIGLLENAIHELNTAADFVEEIQDSADSMENRLKKYRNAIELLGFERR